MIILHNEKCYFCHGQLVEIKNMVLNCSPIEVRYGGSNPMKETSTGLFCRECGLRYAFKPSEVKEYVAKCIESDLREEAKETEHMNKIFEGMRKNTKVKTLDELKKDSVDMFIKRR